MELDGLMASYTRRRDAALMHAPPRMHRGDDLAKISSKQRPAP
jgi:hypothetical protein